jgi:hypothetical protein
MSIENNKFNYLINVLTVILFAFFLNWFDNIKRCKTVTEWAKI